MMPSAAQPTLAYSTPNINGITNIEKAKPLIEVIAVAAAEPSLFSLTANADIKV